METKQEAIDAALAALRKARDEGEPDYTWADWLPQAPPIPQLPDEKVAAIGPKPKAE